MLVLYPTLVVALLAPLYVVANESQAPLTGPESSSPQQSQNSPPCVAIVGAGIAGASTAFRLHELARPLPSLNITIYESEAGVGGRVKSISPPENRRAVVEAGATHFSGDDWCIITAINNVGLKEKDSNPFALPRTVGVWDGEELRVASKCNMESLSWWDVVRLGWKYRLSPWRFRRAVLSNLERWKSFASQHTFDNIVKELKDVGLDGLTLASAENYLGNISIGPRFQSDFVQPCTRARFAQNLADVRGFSSLMAAGVSKATSVDGGNNRVIERMIKLSKADLHLNSQVIKISPGYHRRYRLSVARTSPAYTPNPEYAEFDAVILAASLQSSKVDLGDLGLRSIASLTPYVETHVTHFTTPLAISPKFFDPLLNASVPDDVLTTFTSSHDPDLLSLSKFTICYHRGCLPGDDCDQCDEENLYRVFSRHRIEDGNLVQMIGQKFHEGSELSDYDISWVHRQAWPHAFPRYQENHAIIDEIEIAPKLFYLNGAEEVISSMEMSCRMGHNAAEKLYWQEWSSSPS
jgi:prenylcysteine oxidase / farnesylcysteine lyase